jgi:hypothetical protein
LFKKLLDFTKRLEEKSIHYTISKVRDESILVSVTVPGQRWEIEFMEDGSFEIEKFVSDGTIFDEAEVKMLFTEFGD